jgi:hypothetical protein
MNLSNLIRESLFEVISEQQIPDENIKDILIQRIPFLKEYNIHSDSKDTKSLKAQRVIFNQDVKMVMGDKVITFPQYNVSSEIYYYQNKINDNIFHGFTIKNAFHVMQPKEVDDLTFRVFLLAIKQLEQNLSYRNEIMVKEGTSLTKNQLDKVINDMNGVLFKIEEFTEKHSINLF